jgi:hypothetical protein
MFEIRGLDEAMRSLKRMENNARRLEGRHEIKASDIFTPAFMRRYTKVISFEALIEAGGFQVDSQADFDAIPDAEWEKVVREHTSFASWREMQEKGAEEYASKRLMEGV